MRCPRCGSDNERDVSKVPCSRCGLLVRMPERSSGHTRVIAPLSSPQKISHDIPHRPQQPLHAPKTTDNLLFDMEQAVHSLRLYASEQTLEDADIKIEHVPPVSFSIPDYSLQDGVLLARSSSLLMPGTLLRSGRYRLQENRGIQEWLKRVYEATWIAQDAQRGGMQVIICELSIPDDVALPVQTILRQATIALTSIGRHPRVPTLWDAFSDQGKHFFVFEPMQGETLLERMRRTGRAFSEQRVIEMALQMIDVIESATQQVPSLVHGLIRPEHIMMNYAETEYLLTNFSIVLAGHATQLITGIDITQSSAYFSPEFVQGKADVRSDMYALIATMYHTVTGSLPDVIDDTIPEAKRLNPTISSSMNAFLAKGLHPQAEQRFQRLVELRQAIVALRQANIEASRTGTAISGTQHNLYRPALAQPLLTTPQVSPVVSSKAQNDAPIDNSQKPVPVKPDIIALDDGRAINRFALIFIIGILVCLLVLIALWRFLLY